MTAAAASTTSAGDRSSSRGASTAPAHHCRRGHPARLSRTEAPFLDDATPGRTVPSSVSHVRPGQFTDASRGSKCVG
jgi:hypothetical protein